MEIGNIVLLIENNVARGQWSTGRVVKTYPGLDEWMSGGCENDLCGILNSFRKNEII